MERIDFNKLRAVVSDQHSAARNVMDSARCYPEYNSLVSNYIVRHNRFKEKESALHIMSMQNWIVKRDNQTSSIPPDYGQIWLADLGSNYKPECSYIHPVVIIENIGNMVYVVPSTTSPQLLADAYHPTQNPTGNKFYRKVGRAEGFASNCVLILSNVRAVSRGRLVDKKGEMPGVNDPNKSSVFWEVKDKCFELCFPKKNIELFKLTKRVSTLEEEKSALETENSKLADSNKELQKQIEEMERKLKEK